MKILLADAAGFCYGVRRAVELCEKAAETSERCVTLGPLIHNRSVTGYLASKGVREVSDPTDVTADDTVVIRSHGIGKNDYEKLLDSGATIVDATCPNVSMIQEIVRSACEDGRMPVIIGDREHPEVCAISGWCSNALVFENNEELVRWLYESEENKTMPISVVFQTTGTKYTSENCMKTLKKECTNTKIFDTMCNATLRRQTEAAELASKADAMIVIGGKHSANSRRLAEICAEHCDRVCFVETADELDPAAFRSFDTVGITAGASTPAWIIKEVNQKMCDEIRIEGIPEEPSTETAQETEVPVQPEAVESETEENAAEAETSEEVVESFEEMLEKSIKTLYTGEKVKGVVAAITPSEVSVDLGTKQSGYIPLSELTDDPSAKINEILKVGDEIETFVMRVNDVEGTVMLSKKRLDMAKNWDDIDDARAEKRIVEGFVVEENKGGVVASVNSVRVFIPASQTGIPKDTPMSTLLKTKVRLRITEVNQARRRVVGSIRAVLVEERRAKAEKIWNEIEVGKHYYGTVKSMTSYGAFIDIGGIDGMVHVSELSWTRIRQPSDVLSIGDELDVYVISFDKEKKKISLGYKENTENPWTKFTSNHHVDDVITVKIVKLMPFGAFAEIIPGVDGLIHISQITDHRIGQPSEVLSEGQEAEVKITDIDLEKQKVSLSIRALMDPFIMQPRETPLQDEEDVPADEAESDDSDISGDSQAETVSETDTETAIDTEI